MAAGPRRRTVLGVGEATCTSTPSRPRCARCGEPLGVYEPLVLDDGADTVLRTSLLRLARPAAAGTLFHADCHPPGGAARSRSAQDRGVT
jgi:hypothetical protein